MQEKSPEIGLKSADDKTKNPQNYADPQSGLVPENKIKYAE